MKLNLSTITLILTVTLFFNLLLQVEGKRENFTTHGKAYSIDPTMDSSYNLISKVDQFSELVDTSWDPESPPFSGYFYASITASGLGKLDFSFSEGSSHTLYVGDYGMRWLTLNLVAWYYTEENKTISWYQRVRFPCYHVKPGHQPSNPTAPIDLGRVSIGRFTKNVESSITPSPITLPGDLPISIQIVPSKVPVTLQIGPRQWSSYSRSPITGDIEARWTVTNEIIDVITCMHTNCIKIVPTADDHYRTCHLQGPHKGCGEPYWSCEPEGSIHKPWQCLQCMIDYKPCTPNGHGVWIDGPCPATLTLNGTTVPCNVDPMGYYKCLHTHSFPGSGSN